MKTISIIVAAFAILLAITAAAVAQTPKTAVAVFQLGSQATRIPAPEGFEEAASQFENIKELMSGTESPANDMLAVHMPHADCDKMRAGQFGPFNFYTKVSVLKDARAQVYSADRFAAVVSSFRKNGSELLDVNGPTMKDARKRLDQGLSDFRKQEIQVDLGQPVNLGEFDRRPNVFSFMLAMNFTTQTGDSEATTHVPLLAAVSLVRIKQRMIFVYTYRKYVSTTDVEVLRDFTKKWVSQILAAN